MFKTIRKKIASWILPSDLAGLTRKNLNGVDLSSDYDHLTQEENAKFLANAHLVLVNDSFQKVLDHLIALQVDYLAKQAEDIRQLDFARASINGMSLIHEEFSRLSGLYLESIKTKEDYDKYGIL